MTDRIPSLTTTDLIAAASQTLVQGGYREIEGRFAEWSTPTPPLFEDQYSIVGVVAFDTCEDLLHTWTDMQALLVDVISGYVASPESKCWDGYLVLLTPGLAPSEQTAVEAIRYNTTRLRKLVATGDDLLVASDVERALKPLLPLRAGGSEAGHYESALDLLPTLLASQNIPQRFTRIVIDAFKKQAPLIDQLHEKRGTRMRLLRPEVGGFRGFAQTRELISMPTLSF